MINIYVCNLYDIYHMYQNKSSNMLKHLENVLTGF